MAKDTYICNLHFVGGKGPTVDHPDPLPATATKYDVTGNSFKIKLSFELMSAGNTKSGLLQDKKID